MGTFLFLWALVIPIALLAFGAKEIGTKISNLNVPEKPLSPWFTYEGWQKELLHTNDPDSIVNLGRQRLDGIWEVQLYNKRLKVYADFEGADREVVRSQAQAQFDKWELM